MPLASIRAGTDEIMGFFKTVWDAQTPPVPPVIYQNSSVGEETPSNKTEWVLVDISHNIMGQSTLSGETGNKRFQRLGIFKVSIYTPIGESIERNQELGDVLLAGFEGQNGGPNGEVTFERARYNEIGINGAWFHGDFIVEFDYSTIR